MIDHWNQSCAGHGRRWSDELVHGSRMKVLHIHEYWSRRNAGHGWRRSTDFVLHCVGHGGSRSILVVHGACVAQVTAGAGALYSTGTGATYSMTGVGASLLSCIIFTVSSTTCGTGPSTTCTMKRSKCAPGEKR